MFTRLRITTPARKNTNERITMTTTKMSYSVVFELCSSLCCCPIRWAKLHSFLNRLLKKWLHLSYLFDKLSLGYLTQLFHLIWCIVFFKLQPPAAFNNGQHRISFILLSMQPICSYHSFLSLSLLCTIRVHRFFVFSFHFFGNRGSGSQ